MIALRTLAFLALASAAGLDASAQRAGLCPPDLDSHSAGGLGFSGVASAASWSLSGVGSGQDAQPRECLFDGDGQVRAALYSSDTGRSRAYVRIFRVGQGAPDGSARRERATTTVPIAQPWASSFFHLDRETRAQILTAAGLSSAPGAGGAGGAPVADVAARRLATLRAASYNPARPAPENVTAGLRVTARTYDALDRLTSETVQLEGGGHATVSYSYWPSGRRQSVTDAFGRVTLYEYDARGRLHRVTVNLDLPDEQATTYEYWPDSLLKTITKPDGTTTSYDYDRADRLVSVLARRGASVVTSYAYTYDANGNRTSQVEIDGGAPETTTYAYDELDRLTRVKYPDGRSVAYAYDDVGNRVRETERDTAGVVTSEQAATFDHVNRLVSVNDGVDPANDATLIYDDNGNLLRKTTAAGTREYAYDARNLLIETRDGRRVTARFAYDAFGRRYLKIGDEGLRQYLYDETSLLHELSEHDVELAKYEWGGDRLVSLWRRDDPRRYFHFDALGSVTALTDAGGHVVARYHYDPWGNYRDPAELQASANRVGFTGHVFDSETRLYYAKARYFDPQLGRFLTPDAYLGELTDPPSLNRYLYGNANPTRFVDPTGHCTAEASFTDFSDCFTGGLKGVIGPPANFVLNFGSALLYNATGSEGFRVRGEAFQEQKEAIDRALRSPAHLLAASAEGFTGQLSAFSEAINEGRGADAAEILGSGLAQAPLIAETGGALRMTPGPALATAEGVVIVARGAVALSPGRLAAPGVLMSGNTRGGANEGPGQAAAAQGSPEPANASDVPSGGVPEVRILYTSYGDAAEFARQVAGQEAGLNRMTAGEIRAAIEKFRAEGRPSSAASAIRAARRQNPGAAAGRAGLHNPDCCIGGRPDIIQDFGGLPENSSLGSQNKNNVDVIYDTVKALPSDTRVRFRFVVEQPRR